MFVRTITLVASLALGLTVQATQSFGNHGTISGWDTVFKEHNGNVEEVTNVFYEGPTALKMTQVYDPSKRPESKPMLLTNWWCKTTRVAIIPR